MGVGVGKSMGLWFCDRFGFVIEESEICGVRTHHLLLHW